MKRVICFVLIIVLVLCSIQPIAALQSGDHDDPIEEQPVSFDISQLFVDGRTISAEDVSRLIKEIGLYYRTDSAGNKTLMVSNNFKLIVTLENGEDLYTILNDPELKAGLITRLGYNSDYIDIEYDGYFKEVYPNTLGENEYDFYYSLTPEACELLKTGDMTVIEQLYLTALILYGQGYITEPVFGAEDYTLTSVYKYDVNLDGVANIKDLAEFKAYIAGVTLMVNLDACDINGDGFTNIKDIAAYKEFIAG